MATYWSEFRPSTATRSPLAVDSAFAIRLARAFSSAYVARSTIPSRVSNTAASLPPRLVRCDCRTSTSPNNSIVVTQHAFEHLARRVPRDLVDEEHVPRLLVTGQLPAAQTDELILAEG